MGEKIRIVGRGKIMQQRDDKLWVVLSDGYPIYITPECMKIKNPQPDVVGFLTYELNGLALWVNNFRALDDPLILQLDREGRTPR
jgi:hypothetical protein